jgi:outer membrane protein assembly factor BamB
VRLLLVLVPILGCTDPGQITPGVPKGTSRISFSYPAPGDVVSRTVTLRAAIDAGDDPVVLEISVDGVAQEPSGALEASWDTTGHPDGVATVRAIGTFADGAVEVASLAVRVDNVAPKVDILEPADGSSHYVEDEPLRFAVRADDASALSRIVLRAGADVLLDVADPLRNEATVLVDPETLAAGDVPLVAEVTDQAGASTTATVTIHTGTRLAWRFDTLGRIETPALPLPDGGVAVGSFDGRLYVVGADGAELCRADVGEEVVGAPALSPDGATIYFGTTHRLRAIDRATCTARFTYGVLGIWRAGPTVAPDGTIYAAEFAGTLHAISPAGAALWTHDLGGEAVAAPTLTPAGIVLAGSFSGFLVALAPDGTEKWRFETGAEIGAPALVTDDAIYVGSYDFYLYAVDFEGLPIWDYPFPTDGDVQCAPARLPHGDVAICSRDGNVYAVHAADGTEKWRHETTGLTYGGATVGEDGAVYVGGVDGTVRALGPDGSARWEYGTHEEIVARPIEGNGFVYVPSADRSLYAFAR